MNWMKKGKYHIQTASLMKIYKSRQIKNTTPQKIRRKTLCLQHCRFVSIVEQPTRPEDEHRLPCIPLTLWRASCLSRAARAVWLWRLGLCGGSRRAMEPGSFGVWFIIESCVYISSPASAEQFTQWWRRNTETEPIKIWFFFRELGRRDRDRGGHRAWCLHLLVHHRGSQKAERGNAKSHTTAEKWPHLNTWAEGDWDVWWKLMSDHLVTCQIKWL